MTGQQVAVVSGGIVFAVALLAGVFCAGVEVERSRHARPLRRGGVTFADPDWQPQTVAELVAEPATPPPAHDGCPINGSALLTERDGQLQWDQADQAIHVTQELLDELDERGREFLAAMYEVGDCCHFRPDERHAFKIRAA